MSDISHNVKSSFSKLKNLQLKLQSLHLGNVTRNIETRESCNHDHNILGLFIVLAQIHFGASKKKLDI